MKITISKDKWAAGYRDCYKDEIKDAVKRFKNSYTDDELLDAFVGAIDGDDVDIWAKVSGMKVLSCSVEADFAGTSCVDYDHIKDTVTLFTVNMTARSALSFADIYFCCDLNLNINTWFYDRFDGHNHRSYDVQLYDLSRDLWSEDWKARNKDA